MITDAELGPLKRQQRVVDISSAQIADDGADADVILAVGRPAAVARCRRPAAGRRRGGRPASQVRAELPGAPSMARSAGQPTDAPEIRPGHTPIGHARRPSRVEAAVRRRLHVGDTVVVLGEDVPPSHARVPSVKDNLEVGAEVLDDAASRSGPGPALQTQRRPNAKAKVAPTPEVGPLTASGIAAHGDVDEQVDRGFTAGRLVTVPGADGSPRSPSHQLDEAGQPRPVIADIQHALGGELSPWEVRLWFFEDNGWLGAKRPDELSGPDEPPVIQAAAEPADEGLA